MVTSRFTKREHRRVSSGAGGDNFQQGTAVSAFIYRFTYLFGVAVRKTVSLVESPYLSILGTIRNRKAGPGRELGEPSRRRDITSGLSKMKERLRTIERTLLYADGSKKALPTQSTTGHSVRSQWAATDDVVRTLAEALASPNPRVRSFALDKVGDVTNDDVSFLVLDALHDLEPEVRLAAIGAVGRLANVSAVFSLILLLDDSSPGVSEEAKSVIEKMTGKKVDISPSENVQVRARKIGKLKTWWKEERFTRLTSEVEAMLKS
jgi:hypothetical protein